MESLKRKLAEFLTVVANGERDIEIAREVLAENPGFEPFSVFKSLDKGGTGFLNPQDFIAFARSHKLSLNEREAHLIVKEFSHLSRGQLSYKDFMYGVLPRNNQIRSEAMERAGVVSIPYEIQYGLFRIIEKELDYQRKTELIKQDLHNKFEASQSEMFNLIDTIGLGYINKENLMQFFEDLYMSIREDQIEDLLKRLDKDQDGRLSYGEFTDSLLPNEPFYKLGSTRADTISESMKWVLKENPYKPMRTQQASPHKARVLNLKSRDSPKRITSTRLSKFP